MKFIRVSEAFLKRTLTPGIRHEIDEIVAPMLFLQHIFGHQILDPNWCWRNNAFKLASIMILLTYVIVGTIDIMLTTNDFHLFSEAIFTVVIAFQFALLILFVILYRSTFCEMYVTAKQIIFRVIEEISLNRSRKLILLFKNMIKGASGSIVVPTLHYFMTTLWYYCHGIRVTMSPSTSILMPMTSPTYEVGLLLHTIFFVMIASCTIFVHMWFIFMTCLFCEACDCAVEVLKVEKENDDLYADTLNEVLAKFYSIHVKLMEFLNTLNVMYKWLLMVSMLGGLLLTCMFLLVSSKGVNARLVIVIFIDFVAVSALNLLGERIKLKTQNLKMALLYFDWINMRVKDRRNYCIISTYLNKEFGVVTAVGADLSLLTLSSIYKASYQTYAVLNTMNH